MKGRKKKLLSTISVAQHIHFTDVETKGLWDFTAQVSDWDEIWIQVL